MESLITKHYTGLFAAFLVIFGGLAFYAGYMHAGSPLSAKNGGVVLACSDAELSALRISSNNVAQTGESIKNNNTTNLSSSRQGEWVGSKNGTKYYTPGCPGASRIKPENYIWFDSKDDATVQAYSRGSC